MGRAAGMVFAVLASGVVLFQLALAFGAPWGRLAMGGAVDGALPLPLRVAAGIQVLMFVGLAVVVLKRAGWLGPSSGRFIGRAVWGVVGLMAVASILNLITPSAQERALWAPVALALFLSSLVVATRPRSPAPKK